MPASASIALDRVTAPATVFAMALTRLAPNAGSTAERLSAAAGGGGPRAAVISAPIPALRSVLTGDCRGVASNRGPLSYATDHRGELTARRGGGLDQHPGRPWNIRGIRAREIRGALRRGAIAPANRGTSTALRGLPMTTYQSIGAKRASASEKFRQRAIPAAAPQSGPPARQGAQRHQRPGYLPSIRRVRHRSRGTRLIQPPMGLD